MKVIVDLDELSDETAFYVEQVCVPFNDNAIIIPDGATFGDVFMSMFPNCEVSVHEYMGLKCGVDIKIVLSEHQSYTTWLPHSLWEAPYKGNEV